MARILKFRGKAKRSKDRATRTQPKVIEVDRRNGLRITLNPDVLEAMVQRALEKKARLRARAERAQRQRPHPDLSLVPAPNSPSGQIGRKDR